MAAPFPSPTANWHTTTYQSLCPSRPELSAKGKTVLITGGGSGIGAETARYYAEAGASRIALLGRREQPLLDTKASIVDKFAGVEVFIAPTDVTKKNEVDAAFAKFLGDDKLNVLISNAAVIGPQEPIGVADSEKFLEGVQQNLRGSLFVAEAFLRHAAPDAVVVETSSAAAHLDFQGRFASYSVAKMAIVRFWDSLAYVHPDFSVFHVQPGVVDTDMNKESGGIKAVGFEDHVSLPGSFNLWLASPEARFLKGKFLYANWDVDELKARAKELEESKQLSIGLVGWPFAGDLGSWKFPATWD